MLLLICVYFNQKKRSDKKKTIGKQHKVRHTTTNNGRKASCVCLKMYFPILLFKRCWHFLLLLCQSIDFDANCQWVFAQPTNFVRLIGKKDPKFIPTKLMLSQKFQIRKDNPVIELICFPNGFSFKTKSQNYNEEMDCLSSMFIIDNGFGFSAVCFFFFSVLSVTIDSMLLNNLVQQQQKHTTNNK